MKTILLIIILLSSQVFSLGQSDSKQLLLKKIDHPIKIDGIIEAVWSKADSVSDFIQFQPFYGEKPTRRTVSKVLTTDKSLYCLIISYDEIDNIQNFTGKLDDFGGDVVSIMLDTFGDNRTAYKFAVSASGVKSDSRLLDDGRNRDYNWDGIWFADSKIYPWGFVVEIEIPYKSIQYDQSLDKWGLDFDRWRPAGTEDIYWGEYEQSEGQRISKFGTLLLNEFKPTVSGLNLEIYPVGIAKATFLENGKYNVTPSAGIDIFYNPSEKLTFQLTANPDFAQIEADPYNFNISRYETYFREKRQFFTEGNEVFSPAGRQRNSGFYRPLELFYSRRIGKQLPDGTEVPLILGTKAFGRINDYEYGGFLALTGEKDYLEDGEKLTEKKSVFGSVRIKKQIMENSSVGLLFVGKHSVNNNYGVLDIDGAFRGSNWQLAYQAARSFKNDKGDFALSAGFNQITKSWVNLFKSRYIGSEFDIDQIGYVPWRGTGELVGIFGPRFEYDKGNVRTMFIYGGGYLNWEKVDNYSDYGAVLGYNMNFRSNWGLEFTLVGGKAKDNDVYYPFYRVNFNSWVSTSPKWYGNIRGGYSKTYNFSRDYLAFYSWGGGSFSWKALDILTIGTSLNLFIEGNPKNEIEDITFNARPYFSLTPINDLNINMYADNVYFQSTDKLEQVIIGFLFSYNFSPKSWIYFAINEVRDRTERYDQFDNLLPRKIHVKNRAGVFKIRYLYYF